MARRQPHMERINEASSSSAWCTLATSHSQKGQHRDGRTVITYDDEMFS
jgi:negative elongation factor E